MYAACRSLLGGRGHWTGDLDTKLALFVDRCTELCNLPSPSCLSREMLGMGKAKVREAEKKMSPEGEEDIATPVSGSARDEKEKLLTRILSQGSSKSLDVESVQSSEAGDADEETGGGGECEGDAEEKDGVENKYELLMSKSDEMIQERIKRSMESRAKSNLVAALKEARCQEGVSACSDLYVVPTELTSIFTMEEIFARVCYLIHVNELAASVAPVLGLGESHGPSGNINNEYEPWALLLHSRCRLSKR